MTTSSPPAPTPRASLSLFAHVALRSDFHLPSLGGGWNFPLSPHERLSVPAGVYLLRVPPHEGRGARFELLPSDPERPGHYRPQPVARIEGPKRNRMRVLSYFVHKLPEGSLFCRRRDPSPFYGLDFHAEELHRVVDRFEHRGLDWFEWPRRWYRSFPVYAGMLVMRRAHHAREQSWDARLSPFGRAALETL